MSDLFKPADISSHPFASQKEQKYIVEVKSNRPQIFIDLVTLQRILEETKLVKAFLSTATDTYTHYGVRGAVDKGIFLGVTVSRFKGKEDKD